VDKEREINENKTLLEKNKARNNLFCFCFLGGEME
jgi:hypothetical protein